MKSRSRIAFPLVATVLIVAAYSNSFGPGSDRPASANWTRDNVGLIAQDPRLKTNHWDDRPGDPGVSSIWTKDYWWPSTVGALYRPIVTYSYRLNWRPFSADESRAIARRDAAELDRIERRKLFGFHAVNLAAHLCTTALVYGVAMLLTQRAWTSRAIALLFGLHPIATEAVTNMIGRADLFAAMSVLGALLLHDRASRETGRFKIPWLIALLLTTAFGVFSKENAIAIVPVLVLYDLLYRRRKIHFPSYIAIAPVLILMFAARWWVAQNSGWRPPPPFVDNPILGAGWLAGRVTALHVMAKICWLLIWPIRLSGDYSFNEIPIAFSRYASTWSNVQAVSGAVLMLGTLAIAILLWKRRHREAAFFILLFFITYFPTSNLLIPIGSIMAERFAYLPMVGFFGCVVLIIERLPRRYFIAFVSLTALLYGVRTYVRNEDWRSDPALWASATRDTPNSFRPWRAYASFLYLERAKPVTMRQPEARNVTIDDCISWCEKAEPMARLLPDELNLTRIDLQLGTYYGVKGEEIAAGGTLSPDARQWFEKSIIYLERARQIDQAFDRTNREYQLKLGKRAEDIPSVGTPTLYEHLGYAHTRLGQRDEALADYLFMRKLDPSNPDAYERIAQLHYQAGQFEDAAIALVQELWLDGTRVRLWPALERALAAISKESEPAVLRDENGRPTLDRTRASVQLVTTKAAEAMLRGMLEAKQFEQAQAFGEGAVQRQFVTRDRLNAICHEYGR